MLESIYDFQRFFVRRAFYALHENGHYNSYFFTVFLINLVLFPVFVVTGYVQLISECCQLYTVFGGIHLRCYGYPMPFKEQRRILWMVTRVFAYDICLPFKNARELSGVESSFRSLLS